MKKKALQPIELFHSIANLSIFLGFSSLWFLMNLIINALKSQSALSLNLILFVLFYLLTGLLFTLLSVHSGIQIYKKKKPKLEWIIFFNLFFISFISVLFQEQKGSLIFALGVLLLVILETIALKEFKKTSLRGFSVFNSILGLLNLGISFFWTWLLSQSAINDPFGVILIPLVIILPLFGGILFFLTIKGYMAKVRKLKLSIIFNLAVSLLMLSPVFFDYTFGLLFFILPILIALSITFAKQPE